MSKVNLILGDCLDKLKELEDNSVDSIVTDPPYELGFMGKRWDASGIAFNKDVWSECIRVLKPGGHLLAFGGTRTYHRMTVAIEDSGFEIRDCLFWCYGSGFPKSMDISKQIDKREGVEREVVGYDASKARPNKENFAKRTDRQPTSTAIEGWRDNGATITALATDLAKQWSGWGTGLKPAVEPVVMARKPVSEKTIVDNVLKWGTGGINIDESRIPTNETISNHSRSAESAVSKGKYGDSSEQGTHQTEGQKLGRFPANLIFDEEAGKMLDEQSGIRSSGFMKAGTPRLMSDNPNKNTYGNWKPDTVLNDTYGDTGGASRFFYCPKVSKRERNEGCDGFEDVVIDSDDFKNLPAIRNNSINTSSGKLRNVLPTKNHHPTVKPVDLLLYLIRLVTPPNGTTLDPFMGSGSSGRAAVRGGFGFIGIEREAEYFQIAEARIEYEKVKPTSKKSTDTTKNKTVEPDVEQTLTKFFE
jgi:DNA modification methylase